MCKDWGKLETLNHHVGQQIQLIAKLWNHAEQRYTWAHNLVTSFYVIGTHHHSCAICAL